MRRYCMALALMGGLAACDVGGAPDGVITECTSQVALPPGVATDILFVVDDSGSMAEEQEKVAQQLESFVEVLASGPVAHDFRVALVTTGTTALVRTACGPDAAVTSRTYESGALQPATLPGEPEGSGPTVLDHDDPDFLERFAALVRRGIDGSPQEMGLEAMRLALTDPSHDFLRPGARLLVVVISDEDDCSDAHGAVTVGSCPYLEGCVSDEDCETPGDYCTPLPHLDVRACVRNDCETAAGRALLEPVESYVDFLQGLDDGLGGKREAYLAVIGPVDPETDEPARCESENDEAWGVGVRYAEAVQSMGNRGSLASICADDYGPALAEIARLVQAPQVFTLQAAPPDGRLLVVRLDRADGSTQVCKHGEGFSFYPPADGVPARVALEGPCRLRHGDRIDVDLICAG